MRKQFLERLIEKKNISVESEVTMEGPIARILARSLARLSKQSRSGAFSATQRRCLWSTNDSLGYKANSNFSPTLVSTRNFSRDNGDCNKTDVANSGNTMPIDESKPEVPMEQAPQTPVVKPFDSSYEESTIGMDIERYLLSFKFRAYLRR